MPYNILQELKNIYFKLLKLQINNQMLLFFISSLILHVLQ